MWKNYSKQKPTESGQYVTISEAGAITNLPWSQKHQCFNARDDESAEYAITSVLYWTYFDDVYPTDSRLNKTVLWNERGTNK